MQTMIATAGKAKASMPNGIWEDGGRKTKGAACALRVVRDAPRSVSVNRACKLHFRLRVEGPQQTRA
eukprot:scaffold43597_cov33-Tisochrysis_lutea.AAC.4